MAFAEFTEISNLSVGSGLESTNLKLFPLLRARSWFSYRITGILTQRGLSIWSYIQWFLSPLRLRGQRAVQDCMILIFPLVDVEME